jgi:hypothetical protein
MRNYELARHVILSAVEHFQEGIQLDAFCSLLINGEV